MNRKELLSIREELNILLERINKALSEQKVVDLKGNPIVVGKFYRHISSEYIQAVTKIVDRNLVQTRFLRSGYESLAAAEYLEPYEPTLADVHPNEVYFLADKSYLQYWKNELGGVFLRNIVSGDIWRAAGSADAYKIGERIGNLKDLNFRKG
jgi:hypothetical protein